VRPGSSSQSSPDPFSSAAIAASDRAGLPALGSGLRVPGSGLRALGSGLLALGSWLPGAPGRRDLRVEFSGDVCIVGHASGFIVGLIGPSDSDLSADVASRLRPVF
jgi:hypothetical protein